MGLKLRELGLHPYVGDVPPQLLARQLDAQLVECARRPCTPSPMHPLQRTFHAPSIDLRSFLETCTSLTQALHESHEPSP